MRYNFKFSYQVVIVSSSLKSTFVNEEIKENEGKRGIENQRPIIEEK